MARKIKVPSKTGKNRAAGGGVVEVEFKAAASLDLT